MAVAFWHQKPERQWYFGKSVFSSGILELMGYCGSSLYFNHQLWCVFLVCKRIVIMSTTNYPSAKPFGG
jgi:hypothetical protein